MKAPTLDAPPSPVLDDSRSLIPPGDVDLSEISESSRPMGINIGGHTVTQATEHLPEKQKTLVRWLHHYARTHRMEWKDLEAAVGVSTTTIFRIWKDQYRNTTTKERVDISNICDKIAKLKAGEERGGKEKNPEFVLTTVAELINWLCERALRNHRMAFLFGDGQVGKTMGLTQFAAEHNGGQTAYWDFPPGGVQYMLKRFAKSLLVPTNQPFDGLIEDIIAALDPSKLVIIDDVHRVFESYQKTSIVRCLSTLQYIYDRSGCGMVISATCAFRDQVKFGEFKNALKQLNRRGRSYELMLPAVPPREDLDRIANWFGLNPAPAKSPAESIMNHIAAEDGIGVFRLRLLDAQDYAKGKKHSLCWDDFVQAYAITEKSASGKVK